MRLNCCSSCCSLTASAFGSTELGCWAATGADSGEDDECNRGRRRAGCARQIVAMGFLPYLRGARHCTAATCCVQSQVAMVSR